MAVDLSNLSWAERCQRAKDMVRAGKKRRRARMSGAETTLTLEQWQGILRDFGWRCAYCLTVGKPWEVMTMDHVVPLSRGGAHSAENVVPACHSCNAKKRDKTPLEFIGKVPKMVSRVL